tara:strand:- start:2088 stop:2315 length:228 start_codon:yes stop_codon:yes gene_type:complete
MDIRKISIGGDYKSAMHYIVGQEVLGNSYCIHLIRRNEKDNSYKIYIQETEGDVVMLWKEFNGHLPITVEYNINF